MLLPICIFGMRALTYIAECSTAPDSIDTDSCRRMYKIFHTEGNWVQSAL